MAESTPTPAPQQPSWTPTRQNQGAAGATVNRTVRPSTPLVVRPSTSAR